MNDIDPHTWLTLTLQRIARGWPNTQIADLMPWTFSLAYAQRNTIDMRVQRSGQVLANAPLVKATPQIDAGGHSCAISQVS